MGEKPILFSGAMVRAILAGRKTQTRRVLKPLKGTTTSDVEWSDNPSGIGQIGRLPLDKMAPPRFAVGDLLWVRETCSALRSHDELNCVRYEADQVWVPIADDRWFALHRYGKRYGANVPSIHMPRWASRITLKVTGVKVERLQDISEDDARAEGVEATLKRFPDGGHIGMTAVQHFSALWGQIYGPGSWEANPWVAAISFERLTPSVDGGKG